MNCRACDGAELQQILDLGMMPLAGAFRRAEDPPTPRFPLTIHVCRSCGLVQQIDDIPEQLLFGGQYPFLSSTVSQRVRSHFKNYADCLSKLADGPVVEFGCNDGVLLRELRSCGIACCGVDLAENAGKAARAEGLDVITGRFDLAAAERIRSKYGRAAIVTGSNCFPHNRHPAEILEAARAALRPHGHLCLEVMYAGALLKNLQWDSLYQEHATVYSLANLTILAKRFGFSLVDAELLDVHAGSLRARFWLGDDSIRSWRANHLLNAEHNDGLNTAETWHAFGERARKQIQLVRDVVCPLPKIAAYGASARATMWLSACNLTKISMVADESDARIGLHVPGMFTAIVCPEYMRAYPPKFILITAWNYAADIMAKEPWFDGTWIIPLPELRFVPGRAAK